MKPKFNEGEWVYDPKFNESFPFEFKADKYVQDRLRKVGK
jgi:hypothetical protein